MTEKSLLEEIDERRIKNAKRGGIYQFRSEGFFLASLLLEKKIKELKEGIGNDTWLHRDEVLDEIKYILGKVKG